LTATSTPAGMTIGVLPPLGGSLLSLHEGGQVKRLVDYYFPAYLERFERIVFFSSRRESIADFTTDPTVLRRATVVAPPRDRQGRAACLSRLVNTRALRSCSILRAMQAPGALPALTARVPLVVTYGYSYRDVSRYAGRPAWMEAPRQLALTGVLSAALRRATVTLLTNPALEDEARRLGATRLSLIPNGVPLDLFATNGGHVDPTVDVVVLGRLSNEKNVGLIARAAAHLKRPLSVRVIGDGPLRAELEAAFAAAGCAATFTGTQSYEKLPPLLRDASLYVLPSSTEGRAKALLEAMACGLPCVVSDIPAFADIVAAGAAIAFPPGDERALADVLGGLLADPARRAGLGALGRAFVERNASLGPALAEETSMLAAVAGEGAAT
jgi:glycosyltransferase involved in cell wall biosynthesis